MCSQIAFVLDTVCAVAAAAVWVWLVLRSSRLLHTRPWQAFKVANLVLRLEVGVHMYMFDRSHAMPALLHASYVASGAHLPSSLALQGLRTGSRAAGVCLY